MDRISDSLRFLIENKVDVLGRVLGWFSLFVFWALCTPNCPWSSFDDKLSSDFSAFVLPTTPGAFPILSPLVSPAPSPPSSLPLSLPPSPPPPPPLPPTPAPTTTTCDPIMDAKDQEIARLQEELDATRLKAANLETVKHVATQKELDMIRNGKDFGDHFWRKGNQLKSADVEYFRRRLQPILNRGITDVEHDKLIDLLEGLNFKISHYDRDVEAGAKNELEITKLNNKIKDLNEAHDRKVNDLTKEYSEEVKGLKVGNVDLNEQLKKEQHLLSEAKSHAEETKKTIEELQAGNVELDRKLKEEQRLASEAQSQAREAQEVGEKARQEQEEATNALNETQQGASSAVAQAQDRIKGLEQSIEEKDSALRQLVELQASKAQLEQQLEQARGLMAGAERVYGAQTQDVEDSKSTIFGLQQQLDAAKLVVDEARSRDEAQRQEIEGLKNSLAEVGQKLNTALTTYPCPWCGHAAMPCMEYHMMMLAEALPPIDMPEDPTAALTNPAITQGTEGYDWAQFNANNASPNLFDDSVVDPALMAAVNEALAMPSQALTQQVQGVSNQVVDSQPVSEAQSLPVSNNAGRRILQPRRPRVTRGILDPAQPVTPVRYPLQLPGPGLDHGDAAPFQLPGLDLVDNVVQSSFDQQQQQQPQPQQSMYPDLPEPSGFAQQPGDFEFTGYMPEDSTLIKRKMDDNGF